VVATQIGSDFTFSSAELTLSIDEFSKRYLVPRVQRLATEIDSTGMNLFWRIANRVGTAATTPASALVWLQAGQKLNESAVPVMDRNIVMDPAAQAATVNGLSSLMNPSDRLSEQYKKGSMGQALGFDWYMSQNVPALTTGTRAGSILVDGTATATTFTGGDWSAAYGTIHIDTITSATGTVTQGETFTVADCYAVNPETGQSTGSLQIFTVLEDATAASNEVDLKVWPPIITSGPFKTVDSLPTDGKAVTFYGAASTAYRQNLAFHPEAFTLVTADLEDMTAYGAWGSRQTSDGISIRITRQYDINSDNVPCRLDVLFGWKVVRPELACRVSA
jgi:hypothetical protein